MTPNFADLFAGALAALDDGDFAAAQQLAEEGVRACRRAGADPAASVPGLYVLAVVRAEHAEDDAALALLSRIAALDPGHGDAAYLEAKLRLAGREFAAVERLLARWSDDDADAAVLHLRATCAELQGRQREADHAYALAAALDPDGFPAPVRISDDDVHALVAATIAVLPADVVATFKNLTIDLLPVPDPVLHADVDPEILGLYSGTPVGEAEHAPLRLPDRVYIFKRNIERIAADHDELLEQLRITLLHELGHHLGWDEDDLEARGLG